MKYNINRMKIPVQYSGSTYSRCSFVLGSLDFARAVCGNAGLAGSITSARSRAARNPLREPSVKISFLSPMLKFACLIMAFCGVAQMSGAHGIDSGGGASTGAGVANHGSIGGSIATFPADGGETRLLPGRIEVLFAATDIDPDLDSDGNGLPDWWEILHFGTIGVVPNLDADGDGTSKLMEYLAGTDPRDPTSVFRPVFRRETGGGFSLDVSTIPERIYRIWGGNDLVDWTVIESLEGDNTIQTISLDPAEFTDPRYFLRVEIALP